MCAARIVEGDQGEATTYYQLLQLPSPTPHTCTLFAPWSLQRKGDHSLSTAATFSFSYSTHLHLAYTPQSFHFDAPSSALLHHSAALSNSSSTGASQRQVQGSYSTPNPVRHVCLYRHTHIGIPI